MGKEKYISLVLAAIACISAIIGAFIKNTNIELAYIGIALVIIILLIPIYPNTKSYVISKLEIRKKNRLVRKYFPELKELIERLGNYMYLGNRHILLTLINIKNQEQEFKDISFLSIDNLSNTFYWFKELVESAGRRRENFISLVNLFYLILSIYNGDYVCFLINQMKAIKGEITQNDKLIEQYKEDKHKYISFIEDCEKFGEKIEKEFSEVNLKRHFSFPKDL